MFVYYFTSILIFFCFLSNDFKFFMIYFVFRMGYSNEDAVLMIQVLGQSQNLYRAAERLWQQLYPYRPPHSRHVFARLKRRMITKGIVQPDHNKGKKIRQRVRDVRTVDILASVQVDPHDSLRRRERDSGISRATIQRILKEEKFHPYRMCLVQALQPGDFLQRLNFCNWALNQRRLFHRKILFSDECTFKSDAEVNTWNCRYWAAQNPHWLRDVDHQHVWKINVWCGILDDRIVGPIFYEENLNGAKYASIIENDLAALLDELPLQYRVGMWFQQDGCPSHTSIVARNKLNAMFPGQWIGKYGPVNFPPRSPDLTVLDYYLWGRIKDIVYTRRPTTREDMMERIRTAMASLEPAEIRRAVDCFRGRIRLCAQQNGAHLEHLF